MQHALDVFLSVAARHPQGALAFIGLIAFAESLAIVGTLVPAAVVMFGAGVLAGHGTLPLASVLMVAAAAAIAGDAISFELGRRHEQDVRSWSVFRRHSERIAKAEAFITRHGAASVVMARFTGAVRAFVPLLAGFSRMTRCRFYVANLASALLWAPVHILPGVAFGASLQLAEAASGRLAILALMFLALLWLAYWTASLAVRRLAPLGRGVRDRILRLAARRRGAWVRPVRALLDPDRPGAEALLGGLVVLLGSAWLFLGVLEDVVSRDPLVVVDRNVFDFLQQLRIDGVDRWMVRVTELGSVGVMLPLVAVVAVWLLWRRCWRTAGYWIVTVASAEAVVQILKRTLGRHRPLDLYTGVEQFSFPSGHATMTVVVLAYLGFLLGRGQPRAWRIGIGATVAIYIALVGFSRLYLGAHWLSDVLGGFGLGLAAVALSAIVYVQHREHEAIAPKPMALVAVATVVASGAIWQSWHLPRDLRRYVAEAAVQATTVDAWTAGGFRLLPARRSEVAGKQKEPFTIQIACPRAQLQQALSEAGWQAAPPISLGSVLQALAPHPVLQELSVVPKFDGGKRSEIDVVQPDPHDRKSREVLRLWRSGWQISGASGAAPIWYGTWYRQSQVRPEFSWWREVAGAAQAFDDRLDRGGLQRLTGGGGAVGPALFRCADP